jgi:predicted DNA-binding transcriptional regulator
MQYKNYQYSFDFVQFAKRDFLKKQRLKDSRFLRYEINPFIFNELAILKIISFKQMALLNILFNMTKNTTLTNICKLYGLNKRSTKKDLIKLQELDLIDSFDSGLVNSGIHYYVKSLNNTVKLIQDKKQEIQKKVSI